jgi:hypothetical protein
LFYVQLEVVAVCWDAIDGSTLFELLDNNNGSDFNASTKASARFLMAFWYFSVGMRMSIMTLTHLRPSNWIYGKLVTLPFALSPQPTVDRTLAGLRLR